MDPEVVTAQQALQAAQTNLDNARRRYDGFAQSYDSTPAATPAQLALGNDPSAQAQKNLQEAMLALGKAETEYAASARQLATAGGNAASRVQSPDTKAQL